MPTVIIQASGGSVTIRTEKLLSNGEWADVNEVVTLDDGATAERAVHEKERIVFLEAFDPAAPKPDRPKSATAKATRAKPRVKGGKQ